MFVDLASGVRSAPNCVAWAHASSIQTTQDADAVPIGYALRLWGSGGLQNAAAFISVPGHALRANAFVAVRQVEAMCAVGARRPLALIHLQTPLNSIPLVPGLT